MCPFNFPLIFLKIQLQSHQLLLFSPTRAIRTFLSMQCICRTVEVGISNRLPFPGSVRLLPGDVILPMEVQDPQSRAPARAGLHRLFKALPGKGALRLGEGWMPMRPCSEQVFADRVQSPGQDRGVGPTVQRLAGDSGSRKTTKAPRGRRTRLGKWFLTLLGHSQSQACFGGGGGACTGFPHTLHTACVMETGPLKFFLATCEF